MVVSMRMPSRPFVLLFTAVLAALPAAAAPVSARALAEQLNQHIEQTVEFDDQIARTSRRFTPGEEALGYRSDTHIKLLLMESRLAAMVPKTEESARMFSKVEEGTPVSILGRVRKDSVARRERTVMGADIDITYYFPDETVAVVEVSLAHVGPYRPALDDKSYRPVAPGTFAGPGASLDVRVTAKLKQGFSFLRDFTNADAELGARHTNTLKVVDLVPGAVLYLRRTPKNQALLLSLQRGDPLEVRGRLLPAGGAGGKADRVLIADTVRRPD